MRSSPKVALIAVELGRIRRGFERTFSDLFAVLREQIDVTLFKARGTVDHQERVPYLLEPMTAIARKLPLGRLAGKGEYRDYKRDCIAFAMTILPELSREKYEIIHVIDPPFAKILGRLQPAVAPRSKLLFTEGCVMPLEAYPRCSHIHHVGEVTYREAIRAGYPESRMTLVPCGVHTRRFSQALSRKELRQKHGISDQTFVILVVSAVKRLHKRVDHIIEEASRLHGDFLLWIDGNPEDESLIRAAKEKLGDRQRITHVHTDYVPELYHLADVMVHAALSEAFGIAVIEAISSGLPVLTHNSPHFQWLVGDSQYTVDMSSPGSLTERLQEIVSNRDHSKPKSALAERARQRFDWQYVGPAYVDMYQRVLSVN